MDPFTTPRQPAQQRSPQRPEKFVGKWENPVFGEISRAKLEYPYGSAATTLKYNAAALLALIVFTSTSFHAEILKIFGWIWRSSVIYIGYLEYILGLVFTVNIIHSIWIFLKPRKVSVEIPVTPVQKNSINSAPQPRSPSGNSLTPLGTTPSYPRASPLSRPLVPNSPHISGSRFAESRPISDLQSRNTLTPSPFSNSARNRTLSSSPFQPYFQKTPSKSLFTPEKVLTEDEKSKSLTHDATGIARNFHIPYGTQSTPDRVRGPATQLPMSQGLLPAVHRYQPASPSRVASDTSRRELVGGLEYFEAEKVLRTERIAAYMDTWVENMREWIANMIIKPLASQIERVDNTLSSQGWGHLTARASTYSRAGPVTVSTTSMTPQSLLDLQQLSDTNPVARERLRLEHYLTPYGYQNSREYVLERIKDLADGPNLSKYKWNSGAEVWGDNKRWTPDLPNDAELLMHLFCTHMDLAVPGGGSTLYGTFQFSGKYFVRADEKPDTSTQVQIKQLVKNPPHYCVIYDKKCWDVYSKRNNVFEALVLFIYFVRKEYRGFLGILNLNGPSINLMSVLED